MTDNIVRCSSCEGRKKILSIGGFQKECSECKGIGWISQVESTVCGHCSGTGKIAKQKKNDDDVKIGYMKKRGRKKKQQETILHV